MTYESGSFDVIVVGSGHAGCEASLATARLGLKTLVLTINLDMVAFMPCNPAIGGPAKGIVVREIDALGGEMGKIIDKTFIQMRMLNTGKGPAVHALRAQADRFAYQHEMKKTLESQKNLTLKQALVESLIIENNTCCGVITQTGAIFRSKAVILTTGTYLRGEISLGELLYSSGPNNSLPSIKLAEQLNELGLKIVRFKTGTPPRVDSKTINYDLTTIQPGDEKKLRFSFSSSNINNTLPSLPCWLTYTNEMTHEIIRDNLHRSPIYSGTITGTGPRYCPSIEDKVVRFSDKDKHQLFLEPEGRNTYEVYIQGLSSSLPEDVQLRLVKSIKGLENAEIMRPGYAIEYDALDPTQLWATLELKSIANLYSAGQINGTSGYEEAASQGLIAGINAAQKILNRKPLILRRDQAYIGVLIDDLVTKGTNEPYRLLTSRAEYRLLLRHDNADLRLREYGYKIGLVSDYEYQIFIQKQNRINDEITRLEHNFIKPTELAQKRIIELGGSQLKDGIRASDFLRRTEVTYEDIELLIPSVDLSLKNISDHEIIEQVEIQVKYKGYIDKALQQVAKTKRMENRKIPETIDYYLISGLATEAKEKLTAIRPLSLAQAARISGVNPSDISILQINLEQKKSK